MQARKDQLDATDLLFRMDVHGHAAAIIADVDHAVLVQRDFDIAGMTCQRFIDAVVEHFLHEMVGARGVGIHTGTAAHRVEPAQYFD